MNKYLCQNKKVSNNKLYNNYNNLDELKKLNLKLNLNKVQNV